MKSLLLGKLNSHDNSTRFHMTIKKNQKYI